MVFTKNYQEILCNLLYSWFWQLATAVYRTEFVSIARGTIESRSFVNKNKQNESSKLTLFRNLHVFIFLIWSGSKTVDP